MELNDGFVSEEHRQWIKAATESADPTSVSPLKITSPESPRSPRSPRTPRGKHGPNKGSPVKHNRHSHSGRDGCPMKGGSGGKGSWGALLDEEDDYHFDPNDPNYDSSQAKKEGWIDYLFPLRDRDTH